MNEKDFDKIILKGLKDPQFSSPNWERMEKALDDAMVSDVNAFDNFIKGSLIAIESSGPSSWDKMNTLLDENGIIPEASDDLDQLVAEKMADYAPSSSPKWGAFSSSLDEALPVTKELNLFDNFVQRALTGLIISENPDWPRMDFILDSDQLLGNHSSFDGRIRDAVDQSASSGNVDRGWTRLQNSLDVELKRRRSIYRSKAMEAAILLLIVFALPGLFLLSGENTAVTPILTENSKSIELEAKDVEGEGTSLNVVPELSATQNTSKEEGSNLAKSQQVDVVSNQSQVKPNNISSHLLDEGNGIDKGLTVSPDAKDISESEVLFVQDDEDIQEEHLLVSSLTDEDDADALNVVEALVPITSYVHNSNVSDINSMAVAIPNTKDLGSKDGLKAWYPFGSAFAGAKWIEMSLRTPDNRLELDDKSIMANEYGVKLGLSNGVFDFSAGISKVTVDPSELQASEEVFKYNNDVYLASIERTKFSLIQVPVTSNIHLPVEGSNLDLMLNLGVNGVFPQEIYSSYVSEVIEPDNPNYPIGGGIAPQPRSPQELRDEILGEGSNFFIDGNVGVGLSYKIGNKMSVLLESNMYVPIGNRRIGEFGDTYENAYGLNLGLKYHFH